MQEKGEKLKLIFWGQKDEEKKKLTFLKCTL